MLSGIFKILSALPAFVASCEKTQKWLDNEIQKIKIAEGIKKARKDKDTRDMDSFF